MDTPLIYIIAGEQSGDLLGAGLMAALKKKTHGNIRFAGIGGERMQAEGLASLFPMRNIALLGFLEIIPHLPRLLKRIAQTLQDIITRKPACVITIDSPGFNFRIAAKLRKKLGASLSLIHYVAPTVWAYKPKRAQKVAALYDQLLVILPFEPPYFEKEGLHTTFVGHPVTYEWQENGDGTAFRMHHALSQDAPILCLLPGSRRGEIERHMPIFVQTLARLKKDIPDLTVAVPVSDELAPAVRDFLRPLNMKTIMVGSEEKKNAFTASNAALAKSGTVTLELALAGVPMVAMYKVHPLSAWLLRRMMKIQYFNLINILASREIVPELMQEQATPEKLANAVKTYLLQPDSAKQQVQQAQAVLKTLNEDSSDPSEKVAEAIMAYIVP